MAEIDNRDFALLLDDVICWVRHARATGKLHDAIIAASRLSRLAYQVVFPHRTQWIIGNMPVLLSQVEEYLSSKEEDIFVSPHVIRHQPDFTHEAWIHGQPFLLDTKNNLFFVTDLSQLIGQVVEVVHERKQKFVFDIQQVQRVGGELRFIGTVYLNPSLETHQLRNGEKTDPFSDFSWTKEHKRVYIACYKLATEDGNTLFHVCSIYPALAK